MKTVKTWKCKCLYLGYFYVQELNQSLGEIWLDTMQGLHVPPLVKPHCHTAVMCVDTCAHTVRVLHSDHAVSAPHEVNS